MYLTGGQYKRRKIEVPANVKPTLSKVRESIFNILQNLDLDGNSFLDMCSGSAIMGLEAISRGYIVKELEINPKTALIIKRNYEKTGLIADLTITNCLNYRTDEKYDIIYLDPPWSEDYTKYILKAYSLLKEKGVLIIEYDEKNPVNIEKTVTLNKLNLKLIKDKKYGRCLISFLKKEKED